MGRGALRIYLGAAPGVGKTYAMLDEGFRRSERGADVAIGVVETHGRRQTIAQLRNLEVIPRRRIEYRGTVLEEMDVDAVLARHPKVVLVDELAHTNAPGSRNEKRWQDVEMLLDAGIDVISTLNVQHLESLNDVIAKITGTSQRETVPDAVVRRADQIELVDMSPEALRRRLAHGNIYPAERIDAALTNYFRPGNLGALRELALLWVADRVEESLSAYLDDHGITDAWETRERVVVGITGRPGGDTLIRRAARIAGRVKGELIGVHVTVGDGLATEDGTALADQRRLVAELGGTVHDVNGQDSAHALVEFARLEKATQLVLGASRRSRWYELWHGAFVARVIRLAGDIDIHIIAHEDAEDVRGRPVRPRHKRHVMAAWALTVLALPILNLAMTRNRAHLAMSTVFLSFLMLVLIISAVGGRIIAALAAIEASLLVNFYFVDPIHTLTISEPANIVALVVFLAVAVTVGSLVDTASRQANEASRARVEAEALARSAAQLAADPEPLPGLVDQLRLTFSLDTARISRLEDGRWTIIAESGRPTTADAPPTTVLPLEPPTGSNAPHRLDLWGRLLSSDDQRVLRVLADQLGVALDNMALAQVAAEARKLADVDEVRTALLRAVSHDLRTPLASIKAMVSGLRDETVAWTPQQLSEALATVDEETDRLNRLVGNLLDASRLQIGALAVQVATTSVAEPVTAALQSGGIPTGRVRIEIPDDLPLVRCDGALLERSIANVLTNAVRHSPADEPVRITAGVAGEVVHLCIIDRGPGIPPRLRTKIVAPFQRLDEAHHDADGDGGVGLGLSIAQGFLYAMGGTLTFDDTPGGGLTVTISLPIDKPSDQAAVL